MTSFTSVLCRLCNNMPTVLFRHSAKRRQMRRTKSHQIPSHVRVCTFHVKFQRMKNGDAYTKQITDHCISIQHHTIIGNSRKIFGRLCPSLVSESSRCETSRRIGQVVRTTFWKGSNTLSAKEASFSPSRTPILIPHPQHPCLRLLWHRVDDTVLSTTRWIL